MCVRRGDVPTRARLLHRRGLRAGSQDRRMGVDQLQLDPGAERLVYRRLMALPAPLRAAWGAAALGLLVWAGVWAVIDLDPGWWDCHDSAYRTLLDLGLYGSLGVGGIDLVLAFAATITRPGGARPWGALVPVVFALLWGAIALGGLRTRGLRHRRL